MPSSSLAGLFFSHLGIAEAGFAGGTSRWVCPCDTMSLLKTKLFSRLMAALLSLLAAVLPAFSQTATDEDYHVFTDSPRLIVTNQRLRLLQRERQRESMRWQAFDGFVSGGAPMPEPGFALALYYQVARDAAA